MCIHIFVKFELPIGQLFEKELIKLTSWNVPSRDNYRKEYRIVFLAHQTEIATLFAWVIKLHLTQVFSPRLKKPRKTLK